MKKATTVLQFPHSNTLEAYRKLHKTGFRSPAFKNGRGRSSDTGVLEVLSTASTMQLPQAVLGTVGKTGTVQFVSHQL